MKLSKRWALFCLRLLERFQSWAVKDQEPLEAQKINLDAAWYKQEIKESADLED